MGANTMNIKVRAALIGGIVFGVVSALPYSNLANLACCILYIGGGVLAAGLFMKDLPPSEKAPYGTGALVGVLAGVFGGLAQTVTSLIGRAFGYFSEAEMQGMIQRLGLPLPEIELPSLTTMDILLGAGWTIVLFGIFATIGGLVGVAIFHKKDMSTDAT